MKEKKEEADVELLAAAVLVAAGLPATHSGSGEAGDGEGRGRRRCGLEIHPCRPWERRGGGRAGVPLRPLQTNVG